MKRIIPLTVLLVGVALINVSHATPFWFADDYAKEAETRLLAILERMEKTGPEDAVVEELVNFTATYPDAKVAEEAFLTLATIHLDGKAFNEAAKYYQQILVRFPAGRYKIDALYGLGYCQYRSGRMEDARTALESVVSSSRSSVTMKVKARGLIESITSLSKPERDDTVPLAIGAALPLKGVYATFGEAALKGVLLAADVFGSDPGGAVEVRTFDMADTQQTADSAIYDISQDPDILGIVGPLASKTAGKAVLRAQRQSVPIIALSLKKGIPAVGDYVFRNFLTPGKQAEAIADYAFNNLEKTRFAVLYPDNRYGAELAKLFKREVAGLGGKVVTETSYTPGQKDFAEELEYIFGIEVKEHIKGRRHIREYTSTVEIDALYIPDYPEAVGQIAPYLDFYNIKELQLLGSNGWNSPKLVNLAGKYVEGAVFVDGFFAGSQRPGTKKFMKRFSGTYGHTPGIIEAQAYDAALMLLKTIEAGNRTRDDVRDALADTYSFEGATGTMYFDPVGEAKKELFLLTVEGKTIVEITEPRW